TQYICSATTPRASNKKTPLIPRSHLLVNVGPNPAMSVERSCSVLSGGLRCLHAAHESRTATRSASTRKMMVRIKGISIDENLGRSACKFATEKNETALHPIPS